MERFIWPRGISSTTHCDSGSKPKLSDLSSNGWSVFVNKRLPFSAYFHLFCNFVRMCPFFKGRDTPVQTDLVEHWRRKLPLKSKFPSNNQKNFKSFWILSASSLFNPLLSSPKLLHLWTHSSGFWLSVWLISCHNQSIRKVVYLEVLKHHHI